MINITVGVPSTGSWKPRMGQNLVNLCLRSLVEGGISVSVIREDNSGVSDARNRLVLGALEQSSDYLLFIDSDMGFPDDALIRLLKREKDIVGTVARKRLPPYELIGLWDKEGEDGLHKTTLAGTGFMLIKNEVFKKMKYPWFYESYNTRGYEGRISEDMNFVMDAPVPTYVDLNLSREIVHIGDIDVTWDINEKETA